MITAYPARTDEPLVDLYREWEEGRISYGETLTQLTPDEARDLADALTDAARLCETACAMPGCSSHRLDDAGGMCARHGG